MDRQPVVLFTREATKEALAMAEQLGLTLLVRPFIRTEAMAPDRIQKALQQIADGDSLIFTSSAAVTAVRPFLPATWQGMIYCLQGQTRREVEAAFPQAGILSAGHATALADRIIASKPASLLHFICGDLHLPHLPGMLTRAGLPLQIHVLYKTISTLIILEEPFDGIAFFSPSAVHSFASGNSIPAGKPLFAIGTTTASALPESGYEIIISHSPTTETLLHTIADYYKNRSFKTGT